MIEMNCVSRSEIKEVFFYDKDFTIDGYYNMKINVAAATGLWWICSTL